MVVLSSTFSTARYRTKGRGSGTVEDYVGGSRSYVWGFGVR